MARQSHQNNHQSSLSHGGSFSVDAFDVVDFIIEVGVPVFVGLGQLISTFDLGLVSMECDS